jgi:hypothetical protein
MQSDVSEIEFVDQIGLSSFTNRITDTQPPAVFRAWRTKSQPMKLLIVSLLLMSCLCGSLYYGTTRPNHRLPAERSLPR